MRPATLPDKQPSRVAEPAKRQPPPQSRRVATHKRAKPWLIVPVIIWLLIVYGIANLLPLMKLYIIIWLIIP